MKSPSSSLTTNLGKPAKKSQPSPLGKLRSKTAVPREKSDLFSEEYEIRVICLYPTIEAGKLARSWLESAFHHVMPNTGTLIEYYNYAVLSHDGISWHHVIERIHPDIILMIGDGKNQLVSGFRHSLKELLAESCNGKRPLVIFRSLEPAPTINTSVLLDYIAALTDHNHCELKAQDGNGFPISCFRHHRLLLQTRHYHE